MSNEPGPWSAYRALGARWTELAHQLAYHSPRADFWSLRLGKAILMRNHLACVHALRMLKRLADEAVETPLLQ